jgi:hypothetical protein
MTKLLTSLKEKMTLLRAVAQDIGVMPPIALNVKPTLAVHQPALVEYLQENRQAAQMVASVVLRFQEAAEDLDVLKRQVAAGNWVAANLEGFKGRYLFLCKMSVYFKDFPLLHQLFVPGAAPQPARPQAQPTLPPRPVTPVTPAAPVASGADGEEDQAGLRERGARLLKGLSDRVPTLQAAVSAALGRAPSVTISLSLPAQQTARKLAAMLAGDQSLFNRVQKYLQQIQHAKLLLNQDPIPNPGHLKTVLAMIAGFHVQFQDNPFLHGLFVVKPA